MASQPVEENPILPGDAEGRIKGISIRFDYDYDNDNDSDYDNDNDNDSDNDNDNDKARIGTATTILNPVEGMRASRGNALQHSRSSQR
ncbi:hypothetical protein [Desulfatirhabdium butyrativorans]|uniref:hypothetical protein n=1 Tax=Desulfatirhabdium butyrativorans TaxID=340467 RepID=UPI000410FC28|nr:hypothetical protein [Desulfatirhabdium butyrativorans]